MQREREREKRERARESESEREECACEAGRKEWREGSRGERVRAAHPRSLTLGFRTQRPPSGASPSPRPPLPRPGHPPPQTRPGEPAHLTRAMGGIAGCHRPLSWVEEAASPHVARRTPLALSLDPPPSLISRLPFLHAPRPPRHSLPPPPTYPTPPSTTEHPPTMARTERDTLSPIGHGLLWPALILALCGWVVELAGLASLQVACSPDFFGSNPDAKLTAGFPLLLGCGNQMRFLWFILWLVRAEEERRRGGEEERRRGVGGVGVGWGASRILHARRESPPSRRSPSPPPPPRSPSPRLATLPTRSPRPSSPCWCWPP